MNQEARFTIALVGNPNSGKTTLFNAWTGSDGHVGNYPGVTVEEKVAFTSRSGQNLRIVDLPGTYSLTAYSQEEVVTRNFLLDRRADVVVDVVDSSNLERSLYLTTQLLLAGVPVVLAFNMFDLAEARGFRIDVKKLSGLLGVPIIPMVASKGKGLEESLAKALEVAQDPAAFLTRQAMPRYGDDLEAEIDKLSTLLGELELGSLGLPRWLAIKLLEDDAESISRMRGLLPSERLTPIFQMAESSRKAIAALYRDSAEIILADRRYGFVSGACQEAVKHTVESRHILSDKIDAVVTNQFLGLPIFAFMMYLVFQMTFWLGTPLADVLEHGKEFLATFVRTLGPPDSLWVSLLADGVIEGVGAVLVFVPLIAMLFCSIAMLEASGYMARAAFVVDRLMHKVGLHGKSFIPMLLGFGCTVPAILATRTLETRRDRLTTMLVLPLMSCGARLPVYALILGAFFPRQVIFRALGFIDVTNQALLLFLIYLLGVLLALIAVRLLRNTLCRGEVSSFVMELPPYRLPTLRSLLRHIWNPTWMFIRKAGTIILAVVILMWVLKTWPQLPAEQVRQFQVQRVQLAAAHLGPGQFNEQMRLIGVEEHRAKLLHSTIGRVGTFIAPVLKPCGFDWKISTALLSAVAAKEMFVGQMGVIYAVHDPNSQEQSLRQYLVADYSQLQGFCIMLFVLIASPCTATLAATLRESGSWKWPAFQWTYLTVLAWVVTTLVYQVGRLMG